MQYCPICITNETNFTTSCNHNFCEKCLQQWMNMGARSCPMCRTNINPFPQTISIGQRIKLKHKTYGWRIEGIFIKDHQISWGEGAYVLEKEGRTFDMPQLEWENYFWRNYWEIQ